MTLATSASAPAGALLGLATEPSPVEIARALDEPVWMVDDRLAGEGLARELPIETNPLFTSYVDLRPVLFGTMRAYAPAGDAPEISSAVPAGASALLEIANDRLVARGLSPEAAAKGVLVDTFENVVQRDPDLLRRLLDGGTTLPANDRFAQVARAAYSLGVLVHVPDGVELTDPIVLRWAQGESGRALIARTVISLGRDAHVRFLEEQVASGPVPDGGDQTLWLGTTEVVLEAGATLDVAGNEDFGANTVAIVTRHAAVGQAAGLNWALAIVGGAYVKSRIDNDLVGRGGGVHQAEIVFGGGSQRFDLTSYTRHRAEDTTGDLLSKGIFQGASRGYFKGLIGIDRSARGTDSFLGEFSMLLAKHARSVTIPSLEIDQPDVRRASHASSVGPIDEAQIFYLMSRGITRDLARKFIVLGFLEPVVARIPLPAAQDSLRDQLDRKWVPGQ
ncbi:MAG: SufB/SufD family protein [Candidatus Limnocylindrales bacterium]|jgi:Fe-S cluster assembly scaffold protein SufB